MNRIERYLGRALLAGTLLVMLVLLGLHFLFGLVDQLRSVGEGDYQLTTALLYMLLEIPQAFYELFPLGILLGSLISLGQLASQSELIVLRAAGWSQVRILIGVLKSGLLLALLVLLLGETLVPRTQVLAGALRTNALSAGQMLRQERGVWLKDGPNLVFVERVRDETRLEGWHLYVLADNRLRFYLSAKRAQYDAKQGWRLFDGQQTRFDGLIKSQPFAERAWDSQISPEQLRALQVKPEELDLAALQQYRQYLHQSGQRSVQEDLVFWRKLLQPLSTLAMLVLGLAFVFGPLRSGNFGVRLVVGLLFGFGYYFLDRMFGPLSQVYALPAWLAALSPLLLALGLGSWLLARQP